MTTLEEAITESLKSPELIREYERLRGVTLFQRSTICAMIDEASGYRTAKMNEFFDFVRDYIWLPTLNKSLALKA